MSNKEITTKPKKTFDWVGYTNAFTDKRGGINPDHVLRIVDLGQTRKVVFVEGTELFIKEELEEILARINQARSQGAQT